MYTVKVYDKSKKLIETYRDIHTVVYVDVLGETITVTGVDLLTHFFPTYCSYQLLASNGNYSIDKSIIGTFEVTTAF